MDAFCGSIALCCCFQEGYEYFLDLTVMNGIPAFYGIIFGQK